MKTVPLRNSDLTVKVSDVDLDKVLRVRWYLTNSGYAQGKIGKTLVLMHRHIVRPPGGMVVDHINHDKLDNTRENLRVVTHSQNTHYRTTANAGAVVPYLGVSFENGAYQARCCVGGEKAYLGQYANPEDARDVVRYYKYTHGVLPPEDDIDDWDRIKAIKPLVREKRRSKERKRPLTAAELRYVATYKESGIPMYRHYQDVVENVPMQAAARKANRLIQNVLKYGV